MAIHGNVMVIWYIFHSFGIWYIFPSFGIWYIFPSFGILCQEKSGNPADQLNRLHCARLDNDSTLPTFCSLMSLSAVARVRVRTKEECCILDFSSDFFDLFWSRFYETVSAEIHE
jgi:hypothetical protein